MLAVPTFVSWRAAQWVFERLTMSEAKRKAPKLPHPPYHLPFFGNTLSLVYNMPRLQDWYAELQDIVGNRPLLMLYMGAPRQIMMADPELT